MPRRAARTDSVAKDLTTLARSLGAIVVPLGGAVVDALVYHRGVLRAVDWKTPKKASLTPAQQRLVLQRFPIHFVSTESELRELLGE